LISCKVIKPPPVTSAMVMSDESVIFASKPTPKNFLPLPLLSLIG